MPDAVAVVYDDTQVTYAELDERANRLARLLIGHGVGPERTVGVTIRRSPDVVVALTAILKAGGAYLPVDPDGDEQASCGMNPLFAPDPTSVPVK